MATFEQNIQVIQSTGVYGPDIRAAIAEALTQVDYNVSSLISTTRSAVNDQVSAAQTALTGQLQTALSAMDSSASNAQGNISGAVQDAITAIEGDVSAIEAKVDARNLYMSVTEISGREDEYLLTITNPT